MNLRYCVDREVVKQSLVTSKHEQIDKQTRKQLLETLSGILEKKRKCLDVADKNLAADGAVAASSPGKLEAQKASSETLLMPHSSAHFKRNLEGRDNKAKRVAGEPDLHNRTDLFVQKASSETLLTPVPSVHSKRNPSSRENEVKSVIDEPHHFDKVNLPVRESLVESGRNSSSSSLHSKHTTQYSDHSFENRKDTKPDKPPLLGHSPSVSKRRLQPVMAQSSRRKVAGNDKSLLGPHPSTARKNEHVHEAVVNPAALQHGRKVAVLPDSEIERKNEQNAGNKSNSMPIYLQGARPRSDEMHLPSSTKERTGGATSLQTERDKPLLVTTPELEHLYDVEEAFAFSPPRKVVLKFRGGGDRETSANTTGQRIPRMKYRVAAGDKSAHKAEQKIPKMKFRGGASNTGADKVEKKIPEMKVRAAGGSGDTGADNIGQRIPAMKFRSVGGETSVDTTGQRTPAKRDVVLSPVIHGRNSSSSPISRQKPPLNHEGENYKYRIQDKKPPLLGRSPSESSHNVQPVMSRGLKRKSSDNERSLLGPHPNIASENEHDVGKDRKKPLLNVDDPSGEYMYSKRGGNNYSHGRGHSDVHRAHRLSPANNFIGGRFEQAAERSERSSNGYDDFQDQCTPRFDREVGFKKEPFWRAAERSESLTNSIDDFHDHYASRFDREVVFKKEPSWRQRDEESSWQKREDALWLEEDRQYYNRHEGSMGSERITDLRQRLNYRRCTYPQCEDENYSFYREVAVPSSYDDRPRNQGIDGRRCLLPAPPHHLMCCKVDDDELRVVDDVSRRCRRDGLLGDFPVHRHDSMSPRDDDAAWMNDDRRRWNQSWEYAKEPRDDWSREVSRTILETVNSSFVYCYSSQFVTVTCTSVML